MRSYQKAVVALAHAKCIEDLFVFKSLNYEVLVGDKKAFLLFDAENSIAWNL